MKPFLAVFQSFPVQYHAPVYADLHRRCMEASQDNAVYVVYQSIHTARGFVDPDFMTKISWGGEVLEGYPHKALSCEEGGQSWTETYRTVSACLRQLDPAAILLVQLTRRFELCALLAAKLQGREAWLRTETQDSAFRRGALKSVVRWLVYHALYMLIDRFFYIGELNRKHYLRHAIPQQRLHFAPYCVKNSVALLDDGRSLRDRKARARSALGLDGAKAVFLFSGKLIEKKNPLSIPSALGRLAPEIRAKIQVVYCGAGELEQDVRSAFRFLAPETSLKMAGFITQNDLPQYYLAADCLILPSRQMGETWGLVVNEGMQAGCRVIVSRHVGSSVEFQALPDFHIWDGADLSALSELMEFAVENETNIDAVQHAISAYSVEAAGEGIFHQLQRELRSY